MATIDDVKNMIERNEVKNAIAQLDVMIELCPELDASSTVGKMRSTTIARQSASTPTVLP